MTGKSIHSICSVISTTENELRPQSIGTLKLDIDVAVMEFLSGSRDLSSLPERMPLNVAIQLTRECFKAQRWQTVRLRITSKPCLHSNLQTLRLSALRLSQMLRFKQHIKGDSETALTRNGCAEVLVVTNSQKVNYLH